MVLFSVCLAVLLPFLVLVVEPAVLSPDREVVFFLYIVFIMYCPYICFLFCIVLLILWVFTGYSCMGTSDVMRDWVSCWTVPLSSVPHLSLAGLVPRQRVLPWLRIDRHSVAWPCLPRSWMPSALLLRHSLSRLDCCCVPWFGTGCCRICLPPYLD